MNEYVVSSTFNYTISYTNDSVTYSPYRNRMRRSPETNEQALSRLYDHDPYEARCETQKRINDLIRYTV